MWKILVIHKTMKILFIRDRHSLTAAFYQFLTVLLLLFACSFAGIATAQVTLGFQGGESGDTWGFTSSGASTIALTEATTAQNKVTGTRSLVAGGNTGGGSCFTGGSGNGPDVARQFTFNSLNISTSVSSTRTLTLNWGNRYPVCNGTGWDSGENLTFQAFHNGVAQPLVTIVSGSGNAPYSILTNQYSWSVPPCVSDFYFVISVTTNRADELLFIDNVKLTAPQLDIPLPQPSPVTGPVSVCAGSNATYSVTATPGTNFTWSGLPAGAAFSSANGLPSIDVNWGTAAAGTYTLTVTPSNACGATGTPQTINVTIAPPPAPVTISGPSTICAGQTIVLTSSYSSGNAWSTGAATPVINVTAAGTYTVTVTALCGTVNASLTVTPAAAATAVITAGGPTTFCPGGSVVLTSGSPSGNTWSTGETTPSITVTAAGTYTLDVTSGCGTASASQQVQITPLPTAAITAAGPTAICAGDSVLLTASGGTTYQWSTGATTTAIYAHTAGNYTVTSTNSCGQATSSPVTVTIVPLPTATITAAGPTAICAGDSVLLTASGGTTYQWSTGATTTAIYAHTAGNYTVTSTNSCGQVTSSPVTVTIVPLPTAAITAAGSTAICAGDSVLLTASGGTTYQWSTGATTTAIYAHTAGNYTVTSTNSCGQVTSLPVTVTIVPLPTAAITAAGPTAICAGDSVLLTAAGGTTYQWSTGATTTAIYAHTAGTYIVAAINQCGQAVSAPVTVSMLPLPVAQITGTTAFCAGEQTVLTASGGTSYQWSTGATTTAITVSTAGTYVLTATNACGTDVTSITVTSTDVTAGFNVDPVAGTVPLFSEFTNTSSANAVSYDWDFGDGSFSTVADPAHTYTETGLYTATLTVSNAEGCTDSYSVHITVENLPSVLKVPNVFTPNGDHINDLFVLTSEHLVSCQLQIFNRWGNTMLEINDPNPGWDGTVNGDPATEGTYMYRIIASGTDGKQYDETGFFALER